MKKRMLVAALFAILTVVGVLAAPDSVETYRGLTAAPTEQITGATGADSLAVGASPLAASPSRILEVTGNPMVYARVDFSGSAGDTVKLHCLLWHKKGSTWTFLGAHEETVTAGAVTDANSDNVGTNLAIFDTSGATHVEVRNAAPSAGNVDVTYWVGASDSKGL